jgi:RimJ/RimL family protein N-acetyltransferase
MLRKLIGVAARIVRLYRQRGLWKTCRFLFSRVLREQRTLVFQANLDAPWPPVEWEADEKVLHYGPPGIDEASLTPELKSFLGGASAKENLEGVRNGDHLFIVEGAKGYLHRGYILLKTRQSRIIGDAEKLPVIAYCYTSPEARGRGLYQRALRAELSFLREQGHRRALIETEPSNIASRKGIESAGFALAWEARVWILLNLVVLQCLRGKTGTRWRALWV